MRRLALLAALLAIPAARPVTAEPIATVGNAAVDREQLVEVLLEAEGLNVLMNLLVMELAEQKAIDAGYRVTDAELQQERRKTLSLMFENGEALSDEDREELLRQYLQRENASAAEFDIVLKTNAYLRAVARPLVREEITEEILETFFNVQYGEKVRVRHIALTNLEEVRDAQRRLREGQSFEAVARDMSINPRSGAEGGMMRPFTRQTIGMPDAFKQVAFELEVGQVSDPVQAENAFHLIKLEERIPPRLVKFEDVKEALREQLADEYVQNQIVLLRRQLAAEVVKTAEVHHPVLAEQLKREREALEAKPLDREALEERFRAARPEQATTAPSTQPTTLPATVPTTQPTP